MSWIQQMLETLDYNRRRRKRQQDARKFDIVCASALYAEQAGEEALRSCVPHAYRRWHFVRRVRHEYIAFDRKTDTMNVTCVPFKYAPLCCGTQVVNKNDGGGRSSGADGEALRGLVEGDHRVLLNEGVES